MIAVEIVIRKLVSEYEFVIIPGFGALLSHQVPAIYDKDSGIFAPPVKKLAFNEYLKLDDGLMANFISREEKITHLEAVSYVKTYTDILRSSIKSEGKTKIEGIGDFKTNIEGKLIFEPNTDRYFKDEWFGFNQVAAKTFDSTIHFSTASNNNEEIIEFEDKRIEVNWMRWASAAMIAGLMFYLSFFFVSNNKENIKSTLNPFAELFKSESVPDKQVLVKNPSVTLVPKIEKKLVNEVIKSDSVSALPLPVANNIAVDSVKTDIVVPVTTEKKFYLIAGAFKGTKQAKVLLADLKIKGYNEAIIIPNGKGIFKFKVAAAGYDVEGDAYHASAKLKSAIGADGWVLKSN